MEKLNKVCANIAQDFTAAEKATARSNIDAQQSLVAGNNITINGNTISSSGGGLVTHVANLVLDHEEDTYHAYKVINCINNAINHVHIENHSADICDVYIVAPPKENTEEYWYIVEFNCVNSTGSCAVDVQDARPVQVEDYSLGTDPDTGDPVLNYQWVTAPYIGFNPSPTYQVRVVGNSFEVKRF